MGGEASELAGLLACLRMQAVPAQAQRAHQGCEEEGATTAAASPAPPSSGTSTSIVACVGGGKPKSLRQVLSYALERVGRCFTRGEIRACAVCFLRIVLKRDRVRGRETCAREEV